MDIDPRGMSGKEVPGNKLHCLPEALWKLANGVFGFHIAQDRRTKSCSEIWPLLASRTDGKLNSMLPAF